MKKTGTVRKTTVAAKLTVSVWSEIASATKPAVRMASVRPPAA